MAFQVANKTGPSIPTNPLDGRSKPMTRLDSRCRLPVGLGVAPQGVQHILANVAVISTPTQQMRDSLKLARGRMQTGYTTRRPGRKRKTSGK
jgi:hypothetical protein